MPRTTQLELRLERRYARIRSTPKNDTAQAKNMPALRTRSFIGSASHHITSDQISHALALFQQFTMRRLHLLAAEIIDAQSLNDAVLAVLAGHRIGKKPCLRNSIAAVGRDRHADPISR